MLEVWSTLLKIATIMSLLAYKIYGFEYSHKIFCPCGKTNGDHSARISLSKSSINYGQISYCALDIEEKN